MKKVFQNFGIATSIFVSYIVFGVVFEGNHKWMILFTLSFTFCVSYFVFHRKEKDKNLKWFLILVLPITLFFTILSLLVGFIYTLPYIVFIPVSSFLGLQFAVRRKVWVFFISIFSFMLAGFVLFPNMFVYMNNGEARTNKSFSSLTLIDENRDTFRINSSKIVALDFWTTSCGVCFEKFPGVERNYLNFKNNRDVKFYSINVPVKGDKFDETVELVDRLGYKFPTLYATSIEEVEQLGIDAYPHLLLLKNGKIRYDGRLEVSKDIFVNNIKNELNLLLNE